CQHGLLFSLSFLQKAKNCSSRSRNRDQRQHPSKPAQLRGRFFLLFCILCVFGSECFLRLTKLPLDLFARFGFLLGELFLVGPALKPLLFDAFLARSAAFVDNPAEEIVGKLVTRGFTT